MQGAVPQTCNPSYLGGEDWEGNDFRWALETTVRLHLNQQIVRHMGMHLSSQLCRKSACLLSEFKPRNAINKQTNK
jgi:hypothetical protein